MIQLELHEHRDENSLIVTNLRTTATYKLENINNLLVCECAYSLKTGIICSHILKVCVVKSKRILPYVSARWLRTHDITISTLPKKGRPKTTRKKR
jgi:hypothetical protein